MTGTAEDYQAKADEALEQLKLATGEAERTRLKRAHGCFLKLASHGAEAEARAKARPERLKPEKAPAGSAGQAGARSASYFRTG